MALQDTAGQAPGKASFIYDPKIRSIAAQVALALLLVYLGYSIVTNTAANLERQNIASGFGFLNTTAGFAITQSLIDYSETSTYGRTFLVGLLNTLLVSALGIFFATIIGFVVGISRLSHNWVIAKMATVYVETLRNIPLLLQIFFWYFAVLRALPSKQDKWSILGTFHMNITGFYGPRPVYGEGSQFTIYAFLLGIVATLAVHTWAKRRQMATGQQFPMLQTALGLILGLPLVIYLVTGMPIGLDFPQFVDTGPKLRQGFQSGHGFTLIPEFIALLLALSLYTATFIGEIVRAGILAVSHGQTEAAHALGLRHGPTLRLVIIPQAMRVIIPPLTSQYLNLTKNSSLAVAIAYPDLVSVFAGTTLNQTGQAVEILAMTMTVYLTISLLTSYFMNWFNAKMALVER
ncbi:MAG: amino acid ABC transporter permease [Rhodobiaceae bacterium]|nr:amino acid ABC transporter permease [Rhodobiaceae bacterium]